MQQSDPSTLAAVVSKVNIQIEFARQRATHTRLRASTVDKRSYQIINGNAEADMAHDFMLPWASSSIPLSGYLLRTGSGSVGKNFEAICLKTMRIPIA